MKSLWTLPEPWTPRARPPLLGKPQNGFPRAPTGLSLLEGDISIELMQGTFLTSFDNRQIFA